MRALVTAALALALLAFSVSPAAAESLCGRGASGTANYSVWRSGTTSCPMARATARALLHATGVLPDVHFPQTIRVKSPVAHRWYTMRYKDVSGEGDRRGGSGKVTYAGRGANGASMVVALRYRW